MSERTKENTKKTECKKRHVNQMFNYDANTYDWSNKPIPGMDSIAFGTFDYYEDFEDAMALINEIEYMYKNMIRDILESTDDDICENNCTSEKLKSSLNLFTNAITGLSEVARSYVEQKTYATIVSGSIVNGFHSTYRKSNDPSHSYYRKMLNQIRGLPSDTPYTDTLVINLDDVNKQRRQK